MPDTVDAHATQVRIVGRPTVHDWVPDKTSRGRSWDATIGRTGCYIRLAHAAAMVTTAAPDCRTCARMRGETLPRPRRPHQDQLSSGTAGGGEQ